MNSSKNILRSVLVCAVAIVSAIVFAGCDDVLSDPTFKTWCGDKLCSWKLDSGSIRRAPTWHKNDLGVELMDPIGGTTQISQDAEKEPTCLEIIMVADVDPAAQVSIGVDFNKDGSVEFSQPIVAAGFREVKTQVTAPVAYQGIRFTITKRGAGRAVLAQIRVKSIEAGACKAPPLELKDLPLGAPCSTTVAHQCISKVCNDGLCAECNTDAECGAGETCAVRTKNHIGKRLGPALPKQCSPGGRTHAPGEECIADDDCTSGQCEGELVETFAVPDGGSGFQPCSQPLPDDAGASNCFVALSRGGRCR